MEDIVRGVITELTDEYTFIQYGKLESLVYICLCEKDASVESFERTRLGVSSEQLERVLTELCDSGEVIEDLRPTFGGEQRKYYRIGSASETCADSTVSEVCRDLGDIPVSNLHSMASEHSW